MLAAVRLLLLPVCLLCQTAGLQFTLSAGTRPRCNSSIAPPDRRALGIASLKQLIGTLCRPDWRVLAVLVDQRFGGVVQGKLFIQF